MIVFVFLELPRRPQWRVGPVTSQKSHDEMLVIFQVNANPFPKHVKRKPDAWCREIFSCAWLETQLKVVQARGWLAEGRLRVSREAVCEQRRVSAGEWRLTRRGWGGRGPEVDATGEAEEAEVGANRVTGKPEVSAVLKTTEPRSLADTFNKICSLLVKKEKIQWGCGGNYKPKLL